MTRSFRDPAGSCWLTEKKVYRVLDEASAVECEAFLRTDSGLGLLKEGKLVRTRRLQPAEARTAADLCRSPSDEPPLKKAVFEHERIAFPSYPYEWPPEMLWQAGKLTLEVAQNSLQDGYGLKDATPYNILFRGAQPVFIDVPSFEQRVPGDPVWRPFAQFVRTFLLPLLANRKWGLSLADIFITHRDGLEPEEVSRWCGPLERLTPPVLSLVSLPTWLNSSARAKGQHLYQTQILKDPEKALFILESVLRRLQRWLDRLRPVSGQASAWSDYMATHSYNQPAFAAKEQFVRQFLEEFRPKRVLDAGANTGHFSAMAARSGAEVIAIDLDASCIGSLWQRAAAENLNILPLVVNLARPTPALGWRYQECASFLSRAQGHFDCVCMLALLHHLLVTERIPLPEIIALAAELTSNHLILELVLPEDEMFRILTRGREHLHQGLTRESFEHAWGRHFEVIRAIDLPGTARRLYALKRKD